MEYAKSFVAELVNAFTHWVYVHIDYIIAIMLSMFCFRVSGWGTFTLNLLSRITLGVGVGLLTAFAVTVYKVLLEKKVIDFIEKKKKQWQDKKKKNKKEKSEQQK